MSDLEKELQQMEAQYEEEFGDGADHLESSGDQDLNGAGDDNVNEKAEDDSDYCDDLYCPACEKIFQSTKASWRQRKMICVHGQQRVNLGIRIQERINLGIRIQAETHLEIRNQETIILEIRNQ
eukprot:g22958.t1